MEAAAAMDFHTLSRRELQALCKRNGIRANMTNVAMAEALQGLTSVDGIDEIGTTLCLPTPGRSAMKSAAKVVVVEEQQHGSPLPRGRRVSVKSPEAIRMEVEGGEEGEVKEIVKTPGVALRSTRRGARATPAPLPTPAPAGSTRATGRRTAARKTVEVVPTPATRSQRMASRKAAGAVEADRPAEDVPEEKTSNMTIALDQEAEVAAAASKKEKVQEDEAKAALSDEKCDDPNEEEKVQEDEPKADVSDVKFDDSKEKWQHEEPNAVASDVNDDPEEEVAKILEGENKEEELEEGEEADSSDATTVSAAVLIKSCNDPKVEEVVAVLEEQSTTPHEGIVKEEGPTSVDSPILGVIEKEQDASVEDGEDLAEFSPSREMTDEINPAEVKEVAISEEPITEDKEVTISEEALPEDKVVAISEEPVTEDKEVTISEEALPEDKVVAIREEAVEEDSFANTVETDPTPKEILLTAAGEDETIEEGADEEMPQAGEISEEDEEDFLTELKQGAADKVLQAELELADNETSEEDEDDLSEDDEDDLSEEIEGADAKMLQGELDNETSEEDLDEDEEWASDDDKEWASGDDENIAEIGDDENTEEIDSTDESDEDTDETIGEEANKDAFSEDDDFSGDLPPECDNMMIFSDAETESDIACPVLEENQAAVASATKSAKSHDDSATEQEEGPEEAEADATEEVDNVVKSLDEFTFKEGESEEMQQKPQDYISMSLRKLKSTYKKKLIAAKQEGKEEVTEGKRLPLEEVDENACINH